MTARVTASERDLRTLAGIVSDHRADLPAEGLPLSLLADLKDQIRCDKVQVAGLDSSRQADWFEQDLRRIVPPRTEDLERAYWEQYWDCKLCSYSDRTGDHARRLPTRRRDPHPVGLEYTIVEVTCSLLVAA
jgi:hypothetical protein